MTRDEFENFNISIRPGVVVMDAPPVLGDGVWRPQFCVMGVVPEGWYASRTQGPVKDGYGLLCSTAGRFRTEADCVYWCDAFNRGTAEEQVRAKELVERVPGF
jgi:hypothetical protein